MVLTLKMRSGARVMRWGMSHIMTHGPKHWHQVRTFQQHTNGCSSSNEPVFTLHHPLIDQSLRYRLIGYWVMCRCQQIQMKYRRIYAPEFQLENFPIPKTLPKTQCTGYERPPEIHSYRRFHVFIPNVAEILMSTKTSSALT